MPNGRFTLITLSICRGRSLETCRHRPSYLDVPGVLGARSSDHRCREESLPTVGGPCQSHDGLVLG